MISERSDKIVDKLNITEAKKAKFVSGMIAAHYSELNDIYSKRDDAKKNIKALLAPNKPSEDAMKKIEENVAFSIDSLHPIFLKLLATQLNEKQVIQIKDGLTYSVLHLTYNAYLEELPDLKENRKAQLMTWLLEAREHAMDAESSEKNMPGSGNLKEELITTCPKKDMI